MTTPAPIPMTHHGRRILLLPEHLANKIAAGEVIQRPESVVKELLENALDAGATSITVVVNEGGKELIQVSDDGVGMGIEDAGLCFQRHATSKIASYEELEEVRTFGFRGEALASIAAVAQVSMKTRRAEDEAGVLLEIQGGGSPRITREARERGTTVSVRNLFYNVPARKKFLKSANTEFRHIHDVVQRIALSHPGVDVTFVSDGDVVFRLAQGDLDRRIIDLFGDRQREFLLPVHEDSDLVRVQGYVGKPTFGQRSRFHQYLYLNGRMIVSRNINHAVLTAYEKLLPPGSFPFFVLFLSLDPRRIDVNVHPSKMEVKFDDEQGIHRLLASVVRKVLGSGDYVPAMTMAGREDGSSDATLTFTRRQHMWPAGPSPHGGTLWGNAGAFDGYTRDNQPGVPGYVGGEGEPVTASPGVRAAAALPTAQVPGDLEEVPPLWQLHNRYILAMVREGVLIIDQHVAHERILYEKALARMDGIGRSSQQLLFPFTLTLPASEFVLLEELLPHLGALGFDIKPFGKNAVMIEGVPADVRPGMEQGIVTEMLQLYREYAREAPLEVRDNLAKSFSCKSAVKSGDPLTEVEMRSLLQQLSTTHMPYVCPHGRPVSLRISLDEFDRRFGRR